MTPTSDLRIEGVLESWNAEGLHGLLALPYGGRPVFVEMGAFEGMLFPPLVGVTYSFEVVALGNNEFGAVRVRPLDYTPPTRPRPVYQPPPPPGPSAAGWVVVILVAVAVTVLTIWWTLPLWVAGAYLAMSIIGFALHLVDKRLDGRVPSVVILLVSLLFGWPGSIVGRLVLRTYPRGPSFDLVFRLIVVAHLVGLAAVSVPWAAIVGG